MRPPPRAARATGLPGYADLMALALRRWRCRGGGDLVLDWNELAGDIKRGLKDLRRLQLQLILMGCSSGYNVSRGARLVIKFYDPRTSHSYRFDTAVLILNI